MLPSLCPGQWRHFTIVFPNLNSSPPFNKTSGSSIGSTEYGIWKSWICWLIPLLSFKQLVRTVPQLQIVLSKIGFPISRNLFTEFIHCQYMIRMSMREEYSFNSFDMDTVEVSNNVIHSSRSIYTKKKATIVPKMIAVFLSRSLRMNVFVEKTLFY